MFYICYLFNTAQLKHQWQLRYFHGLDYTPYFIQKFFSAKSMEYRNAKGYTQPVQPPAGLFNRLYNLFQRERLSAINPIVAAAAADAADAEKEREYADDDAANYANDDDADADAAAAAAGAQRPPPPPLRPPLRAVPAVGLVRLAAAARAAYNTTRDLTTARAAAAAARTLRAAARAAAADAALRAVIPQDGRPRLRKTRRSQRHATRKQRAYVAPKTRKQRSKNTRRK